MQIEELIRVCSWFSKNVIESQVENKYQKLYEVVQKNASSSERTPFESEKEDLFRNLREINFNDLTIEQISLMKKLEVTELLGTEGVNNVTLYMEKNSYDIASISQHLQICCEKIKEARSYLNNVTGNLQKYFRADKMDEIDNNETIIRIYFKEGVSIDTLEAFKENGMKWDLIGKGIAMATNTSPEDIKVISAEKGSVIVNLAVIAGIATIISKIILEVLKITEKVYNIKKVKLETEQLQLKGEIVEKLQEEIEDIMQTGNEEILEIICDELNITKGDGEKRSYLKKAIETLLEFSQKGGKLDFIHNNTDNEDGETEGEQTEIRGEIQKLDKNVEQIRAIENKIKLISTDA